MATLSTIIVQNLGLHLIYRDWFCCVDVEHPICLLKLPDSCYVCIISATEHAKYYVF